METILVKLVLPCGIDELENAVLRASHSGHCHDAQVKISEDGFLVIVYEPEDRREDSAASATGAASGG